jgi:hypothetical protein
MPGNHSVSAAVYSRAGQKLVSRKKEEGQAMKKILLIALAAVAGLFVYRQIQADRAEQDLWTEATDTVPGGSGSDV